MTEQTRYTSRKWRPSLSMIVTTMLMFVLALPLGGVWLFRFYDNQLVRETESELIAQGAFVAAIVRQELSTRDFEASKLRLKMPILAKKGDHQEYLEPTLDLTTSPELPRREDAKPTLTPPDTVFAEIGRGITGITSDAQKITLAGFRVLDQNGTVISGRSEVGQSLAHVAEIRSALLGHYSSVIRERRSKSPSPPIYSISRGTNIRVFVAMPIEYQSRLAGVVYLSRTPSHFLRELYEQRWKLAGAALFMLLITLIIAIIFVRSVKGPIEALNERTKRIAEGDRSAIAPLDSHGTREIAELSQGLLSMTEKLQDRSDYIRTFANHVSHELKSPLTSIQGAAELIRDSGADMPPQQRNQFLDNIRSDANRLTVLLARLRDIAKTETPVLNKTSLLSDVLAEAKLSHPSLTFIDGNCLDCELNISGESLKIVFDNLFENSTAHAATEVALSLEIDKALAFITVVDNGSGISVANRDKVLDMFFTTRRDSGGTGMGLSIVQSILRAHRGELKLLESEKGAKFQILLPLVERP